VHASSSRFIGTRLVPRFRELFDGTALDGIVDRVVERNLAERA
jgi:hypothetical protein